MNSNKLYTRMTDNLDRDAQQAYMEQAMREMDTVVRDAIDATDWTQTPVIDVVFVTDEVTATNNDPHTHELPTMSDQLESGGYR